MATSDSDRHPGTATELRLTRQRAVSTVVAADMHLVVVVDTLVSGVHFAASAPAGDVGYKALAVNLSDVAAMGAEPLQALVQLNAPPTGREAWLAGFLEGLLPLARRFAVEVGNVTLANGHLSVTVQVHGQVPKHHALLRGGARPDDHIFVTGTLGDAGLVLEADAGRATLSTRHEDTLRARLARPRPRLLEGIAMRGLVSAAIDISDGLAADLGHILAASRVGACIDAARLPLSPGLRRSVDEQRGWQLALSSGDDYELCVTASPAHSSSLRQRLRELGTQLTAIGRIEPGSDLRIRAPDGSSLPMQSGFQHFR